MGMESKAAKKLGEPVEKTTVVSPRGLGKKIFTAGVAGVVGGVAGSMIAESRVKTSASGIENLKGRYIIVALTPTRLAFFSSKGLVVPGPGDLLAEVPRSDVTAFTVGGGVLTAEVDITLADGTVVALETPRAHKGKTNALAEAMGFKS